MARSASPIMQIEFGEGSPLTDITLWVTSDIQLGGEGIVVDGTTYGVSNVINEMVGMTDHPDVTLEFFYDNSDSGPVPLFETISGPNTPNKTLKVTWIPGSPNTFSELPCAIKSFKIMGKVKDLTRAQAVLTQRGAVVHTR